MALSDAEADNPGPGMIGAGAGCTRDGGIGSCCRYCAHGRHLYHRLWCALAIAGQRAAEEPPGHRSACEGLGLHTHRHLQYISVMQVRHCGPEPTLAAVLLRIKAARAFLCLPYGALCGFAAGVRWPLANKYGHLYRY